MLFDIEPMPVALQVEYIHMNEQQNQVMKFDAVQINQPFVSGDVKYLKTGNMTALRHTDSHESVFYPDEVVRVIRSGPLPSSPLINIAHNAPVTVFKDNSHWSAASECMKYYHPLTLVKVGK